jgi:hypothetical protein
MKIKIYSYFAILCHHVYSLANMFQQRSLSHQKVENFFPLFREFERKLFSWRVQVPDRSQMSASTLDLRRRYSMDIRERERERESVRS